MFDLGTQGHTHFSYDFAYLRLYACYWLDLGVDSNILNVKDLKKTKSVPWPWWLTLIFKVKPYFLKLILFSRSAIIAT